jgi:hypothetical protein
MIDGRTGICLFPLTKEGNALLSGVRILFDRLCRRTTPT